MTPPIAVWRVLACPLAVPEGVRGTDSRTTEGGRDKRPRANRRYGVVVVDFFAHLTRGRSAVHIAYFLILAHFCRAAHPQWGQTA